MLINRRAEFPLQWLGECLINQSILYEGNPDSTNIKERFRYNFDAPPPVREEPVETDINGTDANSAPEVVHATAPATAPTSEPPSGTEQTMTNGELEMEAAVEKADRPEQSQPAETSAQDTEMGGTS